MKRPPVLWHIGRKPAKDLKRIISSAAQNIRLSKRATRLLQYYCNQSAGFAPALLLIQRETGIASNKISEIRKELVENGMVGYDSEKGIIIIDWKRLWIFSTLDATKIDKNKKTST